MEEERPEYNDILQNDEFSRKFGGLNEKFALGKEYRGKRIHADRRQKRERRSSYGVMKITLEELVESVSFN